MRRINAWWQWALAGGVLASSLAGQASRAQEAPEDAGVTPEAILCEPAAAQLEALRLLVIEAANKQDPRALSDLGAKSLVAVGETTSAAKKCGCAPAAERAVPMKATALAMSETRARVTAVELAWGLVTAVQPLLDDLEACDQVKPR